MSQTLASTGFTESKYFPRLNRFFFAEEVPYGLALIRILLPIVLLVEVVRRWPFARELYSTDGATAPLGDGFGYFNFLPEFSGPVAVALYTVLMFALITTSLGWFTRISLITVTILYPYFSMLDAISSVAKYMVISTHILLLMSLSRPGAIWSVDAWLKGRRDPAPDSHEAHSQRPTISLWPVRLIQLLIAISYFAAAVTKTHTPGFFGGEQMQYWMMTYIYYWQPLGDYLNQHPVVLMVAAYGTLVWEILFIACVWRGWGRVWMLGIGLLFHIGTIFMLGLVIFPAIMAISYLSFLNENDVRRMSAAWDRWKARSAALARFSARISAAMARWALLPARPGRMAVSAGTFAAGLVIFSGAGVALEYHLDRYGVRHPDGRYTLERIPEDEVHRLLRNDVRMREEDKFLSFTVGDWIVGGHLIHHRDSFQVGETFHAQAALNPPHEDMWIEVNLHDVEDHQLTRVGQIVPRENQRVFFNYRLDESYDPGEYDLVLKSGGREISRRRIHLLPNEGAETLPAPVAN